MAMAKLAFAQRPQKKDAFIHFVKKSILLVQKNKRDRQVSNWLKNSYFKYFYQHFS